MIKNLRPLPRHRLCELPTPMTPLSRFSDWLGGPTIWIKRDDLTGLALGGNKARKLEYVLIEAQQEGADTLLTIGALQSNHVRQTAAAAASAGLRCRALLGQWVDYQEPSYLRSGNRLLDELLGLEVIEADPTRDPVEQLAELHQDAIAEGLKPYSVALGASTALGALGYARCANEILSQATQQGITLSAIFHASGSGGTQAGLLAGVKASDESVDVQGVSVYNPDAAALRQIVFDIAEGALDLLQYPGALDPAEVLLDERFLGPAYGIPTTAMQEALRELARLEAIILDPVYTGKAMAGLIQQVRDGVFARDEHIVFVHTGGTPGLFAYSDILERETL